MYSLKCFFLYCFITVSLELQRCLNGIDLMFLSIGSMVGGGVYVATGSVAREAGPSVIISCALAGIASMLSALCYAGNCFFTRISMHHIKDQCLEKVFIKTIIKSISQSL